MIVNDSICNLLGYLVAPSWSHGNVERLDTLFERRTHTSTHLIFLKRLLGGVLVVQRLDRHEAVTRILVVDVGRDLRWALRWVILQLKGRLLLVFLQCVRNYVARWSHVRAVNCRCGCFEFTDDGRLVICRVVISTVGLNLISRGECQRGGLKTYLAAICLLYFI